jgi:hypothetical protein
LDFGLCENVRADEKLAAFLELERPVYIHLLSEQFQPFYEAGTLRPATK